MTAPGRNQPYERRPNGAVIVPQCRFTGARRFCARPCGSGGLDVSVRREFLSHNLAHEILRDGLLHETQVGL